MPFALVLLVYLNLIPLEPGNGHAIDLSLLDLSVLMLKFHDL